MIYQGTSINEFSKIRDRLDQASIKYKTKVQETKDRSYINKGQEIGIPASEGIDVSKIYVIYIDEADLKKAREVLMEIE